MLRDDCVDLFKRIPERFHSQVNLILRGQGMITVDTVVRFEPTYLVLRGLSTMKLRFDAHDAAARKVASWLLLAVAVAAAASLVQVAGCVDQEIRPHATTLAGKFMRKCWRARGFYSIYMTLAGVLAMTVTAAPSWNSQSKVAYQSIRASRPPAWYHFGRLTNTS